MGIIRAHQLGGSKVKADALSSVNMEEITELRSDLNAALRSGQLQVAVGLLERLIREIPSLKRSCNVFINTLKSIREGMHSGALTGAEAKSEVAEGKQIFDQEIEKTLDDLEGSNTKIDHEIPLDLGQRLPAFEQSADQLQKKMAKTGLVLAYAPILPLVQPPFSADALKKLGFQFESISNYIVLHKQLVLGVSHDYVDKHMDKKLKKEDVLKDVVEVAIAKHANLNLTQVGGFSGWDGAYWAWLCPSRELTQLRKCTIAGPSATTFKVARWSFPFYRHGGKK